MNTNADDSRRLNYDVLYSYDRETTNNIARYLLPTLVGIVLAGTLNSIKIPSSLVAIVTGGSFGVIGAYFPSFNQMANHLWEPGIISILFTPIVILKLIYFTDPYLMLKSLHQIILISTVGVLLFVCAFGFMLLVLTNHAITFVNIAVAGMLFVPNDVPDIILELDGIKNLEVIMDGESIFGTAFCLMTYELCYGYYSNFVTHWYQFILLTCRFTLISIVAGVLFGIIVSFIFRQMYDDAFNATTTLLGMSYFLYAVCDRIIFCNPVIAIFIVTFYVAQERARLSGEVDADVMNFLNICYYTIEVITNVALSNFIVLIIVQHFKEFDVFISLGAYIIGNVIRLLSFIIISPVLSRVGYGLNFTSMITIFWAAKKGPMIILQAIALSHDEMIKSIGIEMLCFIIAYFLLTIIINGTTLKIILRTFGLIKFSITRKHNINNGFKSLLEKRNRIVVMMKMNRYFSDANWPLIHGATKLVNLYQSETGDEDAEGNVSGWRRETFCPTCQKHIAVEPTRRDLIEMSKDTGVRILKALRVSFASQYEHGLLTKDELRTLMQSVDIAMDSEDLVIKLDDLFKIFRDRTLVDKVKKILQKIKTTDIIGVPRQRLRKRCYIVTTSVTFEIFMLIIIILNIIAMIYEFVAKKDFLTTQFFTMMSIDIFFTLLYTVECGIKILAMSYVSINRGIVQYFTHYWTIFDFCLLLINWIDIIFYLCMIFNNTYFRHLTIIVKSILFVRVVRVIQVLRLIGKLAPQIVMNAENKIDVRVSFVFTIGTAMILSYEEIIEQLGQISYNDKIRDQVKLRLDTDKLAITQELGFIEKERPWITVTVKTKQAMRATMMSMRNAIFELKSAGFVDKYEYTILKASLAECFKVLAQYKSIVPLSPKHVFYEIPWMQHEENIIDYLYENVTTKIWNAGDVICDMDVEIEGVFIVVAGVFKVTYVPSDKYLNHLADYGSLPVKDVLNNARFNEIQEDYILKGNSIGELSVLTGRAQSCTIVSSTPSQAFIIPSAMLADAMAMSADPINGLSCRMWKYCCFHLARRILLETPMYQALGTNYMNVVLDRAFIPNLNHYKVCVINDWVEDVVLLEGLIVDFNTREIFTAPCYIPRTVQKMVLPESSSVMISEYVITRLMIIPIKDIDPYDLMQRVQGVSQTSSEFTEVYMKYKKEQHIKRYRSNWFSTRRNSPGTVIPGFRISKSETSKSSSNSHRGSEDLRIKSSKTSRISRSSRSSAVTPVIS